MNVTEGYPLDTNIASASWDLGAPRHADVRQRLKDLEDHLVYVSAVSIAEVEYGLHVAPAIDSERQEAVRNAMAGFKILEITEHTARTYAQLRANLFRSHSPKNRRGRLTQRQVEDLVESTTGRELGIQENDLWIVSVAVEQNLIFVTGDRMERVIEAAHYAERTEFWN